MHKGGGLMRKYFIIVLVAFGVALSGSAMANEEGAAIFKKICSACHGKKGEGKKKMGPAFVGNEFIQKSSEADITLVIKNGRMGKKKLYKDIPVPMMPQKKLTDEQIKSVIAYIKGLAG